MNILKLYCVRMVVAVRIKDNKLKCYALNNLYSLCRFHATAFCYLANKLGLGQTQRSTRSIKTVLRGLHSCGKQERQCTRRVHVTIVAV
jgi:hypothetical protein